MKEYILMIGCLSVCIVVSVLGGKGIWKNMKEDILLISLLFVIVVVRVIKML